MGGGGVEGWGRCEAEVGLKQTFKNKQQSCAISNDLDWYKSQGRIEHIDDPMQS